MVVGTRGRALDPVPGRDDAPAPVAVLAAGPCESFVERERAQQRGACREIVRRRERLGRAGDEELRQQLRCDAAAAARGGRRRLARDEIGPRAERRDQRRGPRRLRLAVVVGQAHDRAASSCDPEVPSGCRAAGSVPDEPGIRRLLHDSGHRGLVSRAVVDHDDLERLQIHLLSDAGETAAQALRPVARRNDDRDRRRFRRWFRRVCVDAHACPCRTGPI
jgi:hypothetical protein